MNAQLSPPGGPTTTDSSFTSTKQFMDEMARLFDSSPPPEEFHRAFLEGVLKVTQAAGGAIWVRSPGDDWQLRSEMNIGDLGLGDISSGMAMHGLLVRQAGQRDKPFWVPARHQSASDPGRLAAANPTSHVLAFSPVLADNHVVGIVEIWFAVSPEHAQRRLLARLLMEMAAFEAAYLHKSQWQSLLEHQRVLTQVETFARQIHASLDTQEVSYFLANDCRRILGCDQVSVVGRRGKSAKLEAVSGSPGFDKQSRLVQCMQALGRAVLGWGGKLSFQGIPSEELPAEVRQALDAYLTESNSRWLLVIPLADGREKAHGRRAGWALFVESFESTLGVDQCEAALELLIPHAAAALYNAGQFRRLPLRPVIMSLARIADGLRARSWIKLGLFVGVAALAASLFVFLQVPYRREATGQLVPLQRQLVFSPLGGKIVEVKVVPGDVVEKGQELLFLEDLETQLQIDQLNVKIASTEQKLIFLSEQFGKAHSPEERVSLTKERLSQDYELRKAMAEREILFAASRSPRKAAVPSPLNGKVVTFDAHEQLLGKTVKPGDALLRVATVKGPWEIELHIPEAHINSVRESLEKAGGGELDIDLLLVSQPQRIFKGKLQRNGLGGETIVKDGKVMLPARASIADADLAGQLERLPVGVEVRAKVHCGRRSLGYVWFSELWEFLYENLLF